MTMTERALNEAQTEVRRRIINALSHRSFALVGVTDYAEQIADVVLAEFPVAFWMPGRIPPPQTRYLCLRSEPERAPE